MENMEKALSLVNANSNYIENASVVKLPLGANDAFSFCFWLYLPVDETDGAIFLHMGGYSSGEVRALIRWNGHIYFWGAGNDVDSLTAFNVGAWQHIAVTCDASTLTIYKNGVVIASAARPAGLISSTLSKQFDFGHGWQSSGFGHYPTCYVDEVQIFNRALSQSEIQADLNGTPLTPANVVVVKVPQGTTQVIATLSWQGIGNINATISTPSQNYTENMLPEYQKTSHSTSNGINSMINIKRISVSVTALSSDQNWNITLALERVDTYQITVEVQK